MQPYNATKNLGNVVHMDEGDMPSNSHLHRAVNIEGGMIVRLAHLESNGHIIARYDDESLLTTNMAPLGLLCQQILDDISHQMSLYVRRNSLVSDANSANSIWQILPSQINKLGVFRNGDLVRFRHALTGQYLCIRPVEEGRDSVSIRTRSILKSRKDNGGVFVNQKGSHTSADAKSVDELHAIHWVVATTAASDASTLFFLFTSDSVTENKDDVAAMGSTSINNQSDVFFMHEQTQLILEEKKGKTAIKTRRKKKRKKSRKKIWEDYTEDISIRPSYFNDSNVAVLREVYNIEPVTDNEVTDILYVSKFIPLVKSSIIMTQHTKKMNEIFLPMFRHLNVAVHTLVLWVMNQCDSDNSLITHPALSFDASQDIYVGDEEELNLDDLQGWKRNSFENDNDKNGIRFEYQSVDSSVCSQSIADVNEDDSQRLSEYSLNLDETTRYTSSSLGPWIGRGMTPYKKSSIVNPIHSSRNPTFSDYNTKRQNIVSDSRILDLLIFYTSLVFRLLKDQVLHVEKREGSVAKASKFNHQELIAMYQVPSLLTGTCVLIHDLIHAVVHENRRNSVRVLSVKGTLLNFMDQEILGWNPPIDTLLIALQSKKKGTVQNSSSFDPTMVLGDQNIHNLIKKAYELYMTNNESAVNLVKLLTTLCSPGQNPNPVFQSLVLKTVFSTEMKEGFVANDDAEGITTSLCHSLLFSIRKFNDASWQVKFKVPFKMGSYHVDSETIKLTIKEELRALKGLISPRAEDGRLSIIEAKELLAVLGLSGYSLYAESNSLEFATIDKLMEWYWKKRSHFFPSPCTPLNEISYTKVKSLVNVESIFDSVPSQADMDVLEALSNSDFDSASEEEEDVFENEEKVSSEFELPHVETKIDRGGFFGRFFGSKQKNLTNDEDFRKEVFKSSENMPSPPKKSTRRIFGLRKEQPKKQISFREELRQKSDKTLHLLTPQHEYFEFRELIKTKISNLDIGPYNDGIAECFFHDTMQSPMKSDGASYGGVEKKGLSMFLLYPAEEALSKMKKKIRKRQDNLEWEGIFQVLSHSSFERNWLRESIILMAELCRGENLIAQSLINKLFPAPMVLELFSFGGQNGDKLAIVTLLQNVYVVHDLVFPISAVSVSKKHGKSGNKDNPTICSLNESDSSVMFDDAGKVFNDMTISASGEKSKKASSRLLRQSLWKILSDEINGIDLTSQDNDLLCYHACLLALLRELICRGFFVESADFEAEHKRMREINRSNQVKVTNANQKKQSIFSHFNDLTTKSLSFSEPDIRTTLVKKVTAMVDSSKFNVEAVRIGVLNTLDKNKAINKVSEGEYANRRHQVLQNSNPVSVGSEHFSLVNEYFTESYSNSLKILLVQEVIAILDLIYDAKELNSVKRILSLLNHTHQYFPRAVLRGEEILPEDSINFSGAPAKINDVFLLSSDSAALYTDALLALTLFNSDRVKARAYDLLYKNASMKMNAYEILKEIRIYVCPRKAATLRLFQQFQYIARRYSYLMMYEVIPSNFNYKRYVSFAMEAMKSLCHHTFHDKSSHSILDMKKPGSVTFLPDQFTEVPIISFIETALSFDSGIELPSTSTLAGPYRNVLQENASLLSVTSKYRQYFDTTCEDHASDVSREIIDVFLKDINEMSTSPSGKVLWTSLDHNHQYVVNAMFATCAHICVNRPELVNELLLKVSTAAVSFMWNSDGACRVVELYSRFCDISDLVEEEHFFHMIDELFVSIKLDNKPNISAIRLLRSILSSKRDSKFVRRCHKFVDKNLLSDGSMRKYILLDMLKPNRDDIEFHFEILGLLSSFATISNQTTVLKLQACLSVSFCEKVLSSCCPLQIKVVILKFCSHVYKNNEISLFPLISRDLKRIWRSINENGKSPKLQAEVPTSSTEGIVRRFDSILHPLLEYVHEAALVIANAGARSFSIDYDDIKSVRTCVDFTIRDRSFMSMLKSKKVIIPHYIRAKVIKFFEEGNIDHAFLSQFFDCVLTLYNIIKLPSMDAFFGLLVSKTEPFDAAFFMFTVAYLITFVLNESQAVVAIVQETMVRQNIKVNPNMAIKNHLEAALLTLSKSRDDYENEKCRETFLLMDGIQLFNRKVSRVLFEDSTQALKEKSTYVSLEIFSQSMDHSHDLSSSFIKKTILFQSLQKHLNQSTVFMDNGGKQLLQGTLINETSTLKKTSDFEKWTMCGGSFFRGMGTYLQNYSQPNPVNFFLLHILCELLENDIDGIRSSENTTKKKIQLMSKEVSRLQRLQDTFQYLGICDLPLAIVGRSLDYPIDDAFVLEFVPLALKVGFSLLASGNDSVQETLMMSYKNDCTSGMVGSHRKRFMESLRRFLRGIMIKVDAFTKIMNNGKQIDNSHVNFPVIYLKALIKAYDFCGSLCSGHNDAARNFLRDQDQVGEPIDIVFDIAKSLHSVLALAASQMHYITYDYFYETLAPPVWYYYPDVKRRFIKWHDPRVDFDFVCQTLAVVSSGFNALTEICQGPCFKNQPSALIATPYCQDLLEYVGAMQLRVKVNKPGPKTLFGSNSIIWDGHHPLSFNKTYKHELKKLGRFRDDPDFDLIVKQIQSLSEKSKETKQFNARHGLLIQIAQGTEQSCLRFLLALLEATSPIVSETLIGNLNDSILLQNMENQYKLSFNSKGKLKQFRSEVTVSYLTLISIMASIIRDDPNAMLDDFLHEWKQENAAQGYNTEKLVASIEITSQDGSVQRVYFAIPPFVITYWSYPEVQKAKHKFLWDVSRESPEDKLSDFYDRSESLMHVMRRQELLRLTLTPLIHGMFGGVNFFVEKIFFLKYMKMQPIFLIMSFCFNVANMYWQYRLQYPWIIEGEYSFFQEMMHFEGRDKYLFYVYCVHFSLASALFIRAFLNSPAADNFKPFRIISDDSIIDGTINGVVKVTLTLIDSWWPICLMGFSACGILINPYFFAPILLDVINQVRLMSFLLEAITRNLGRIAYTLLLAIIFLYLFAVITIVTFKNQYALAGKSACNDLVSCFKLQFDYGLVNPPEWVGDGYIDPYISADAESSSYGHIGSILAGSLFNFSYIILINLVLQAIISGLIIDTFSEMRAESEEIEVDIREKCFICSIDRDEFEQLDIPFVEHVKSEHNMWQYIWFMIYLESKDPLSYTGPEQYIAENLTDKNGFVRLGPIRKSLSIALKAGKAKEKINLGTILENIRQAQAISSSVKTQVEVCTKLTKDNQKSSSQQKSKLSDMEKLLKKSTETVVKTSGDVAELQRQSNTNFEKIFSTFPVSSTLDT